MKLPGGFEVIGGGGAPGGSGGVGVAIRAAPGREAEEEISGGPVAVR